ncbi:hypothetical protein GW796_11160 [archaeon]|nr:hypothetical protein [archaeon]
MYASYQLFFFTLFGSIFMFFGILMFHNFFGTTDFLLIQIYNDNIINITKLLLFTFFFIAFAIKIPVVPLHF